MCIFFTGFRRQTAHAEWRLGGSEIVGVAKETEEPPNKEILWKAADDLGKASSNSTIFIYFLLRMSLVSMKKQTCLNPLGIKTLIVQSSYTFTYKHSRSKRGIRFVTEKEDLPTKSTTINETWRTPQVRRVWLVIQGSMLSFKGHTHQKESAWKANQCLLMIWFNCFEDGRTSALICRPLQSPLLEVLYSWGLCPWWASQIWHFCFE